MRHITIIAAALATAALATTYIQTSSTGTAPWKPVKDSVSLAHLADSALHAPPSAYADSARVSGLADSSKKAGTANNSLALGGVAAAGYGTLSQDTLIAKKVASDTANVLRSGIASAVTTSEAYATARISDSLTANTRAWTTLAAAKSSIHDSLAVERTFDTAVSRNVVHDSMLYRDTAYLLRRSDTSYVTWGSLFVPSMGWFWGVGNNARMTVLRPDELLMRHRNGGPWARLLFNTYDNEYGRYLRITGSQFGYDSSCGLQVNGPVSATSFSGNATTATKLAAARTIGMSGDVVGTATAFDGTANITIPTTLPTLLTAGSAGSATAVPTLTWDAKGRLTSVGSATIAIPHTQINDWGTYINQPLLTTSSPTFVNVTANLIGSASGLGGVGSDYFVQGNGIGDWGHRTTTLTGSAAFTQGLQSGFFDNDVAGVTPNNNWAFLVNAAHSSSFSANKYQFQIAASFDNSNSNNFGGEGYWVRVVNQPGGVGAWRTLLHNGNVGNYAIPLTGSSAITGPLVSSSTATFVSGAQAPISISGWSGLSGKTFIGNVNESAANGLVFFSNALQVHGVNGIDIKAGGVAGMSFYPTNIVAYLPVSFNGAVTANNGLQTTTYADFGSVYHPWGTVYASAITNASPADASHFDLAGTTLTLYKYVSQGNTFTSTIEGTGRGLLLSSTAISGTFSPEVNSPSTEYTISSSDQGKMVVSINKLNLPTPTGVPKGFWCIINWHSGGSGVKLGPSTSGTAWNLRGSSTTVGTTLPVSGIASWDGYTWYVN